MFRIFVCACIIAVNIVAFTNTPVLAKKVDLPGTRSKDYMKSLCGQVGGNYSEGQGQYGCTTNCGQQGQPSDSCGINCSEATNKCYGWTPGRTRPPRNPAGILHPRLGGLKLRAK